MVELTPKVNHPFWWLTLPHVVVDFAHLVADFALLVVDFAPDPMTDGMRSCELYLISIIKWQIHTFPMMNLLNIKKDIR